MIDYKFSAGQDLKEALANLSEITRLLRSEDGCPWDKAQTMKTISSCITDESYELSDASIKNDPKAIAEELGDVLINCFLSLGILSSDYSIKPEDVVNGACEKLVRRHPYVFSSSSAKDVDEALKRWDDVKKSEGRKDDLKSTLEHIPTTLPPLEKSYEIQRKLKKCGFDYPVNSYVAKTDEELLEVKEAIANGDKDATEEEIGDLLMSVLGLSIILGLRPDVALMKANDKISSRFIKLQEKVEERGFKLTPSFIKDNEKLLNDLWAKVKASERS